MEDRMNLLVTGHKGYIGSAFIQMTEDQEYTKRGIYTATADIKDGIDLTDPKTLAGVMEGVGPSVVLNLAGLSGIQACSEEPVQALEVNGVLPAKICEYLEPSALFIQASSCSCYESATRHLSVYRSSKLAAEARLNDAPCHTLALRFGTVYGPSPNMRLDLPIHKMIVDGLKGRITIPSRRLLRPWLHIDDLIPLLDQIIVSYYSHKISLPGHNVVPVVSGNSTLYKAAYLIRHAMVSLGRGDPKVAHDSSHSDLRSYAIPTVQGHEHPRRLGELVEFIRGVIE